jgi:hypothetical protein
MRPNKPPQPFVARGGNKKQCHFLPMGSNSREHGLESLVFLLIKLCIIIWTQLAGRPSAHPLEGTRLPKLRRTNVKEGENSTNHSLIANGLFAQTVYGSYPTILTHLMQIHMMHGVGIPASGCGFYQGGVHHFFFVGC